MTVICIDTQILFWALVKKPPKNNEHLVRTATDFMKWVDQQKHQVILPTIILGEMLVAVPKEDHPSVLKQINRDWRVVEYDLPASVRFAVLQQDHIIKNRIGKLLDPNFPHATRASL